MRQFLRGAIAGGVGAAVVMVATAAMAGTGIGGVFNLGKTNTVNATTSLTGSTTGAQLGITNSGAGPALALEVPSGKPPLTVNSSTRVKNLNASMLSGFTPSQFVQGGGQVRGFTLTMNPGDSPKELLAIPGYGQLQAQCRPDSTGFINYINGSHSVDAWWTIIDNDQFVTADKFAVQQSHSMVILEALNPPSDGQARLLLHYATASGFILIQHVATVDAAVFANGGATCSFVASTMAGATGRFAP